MVANHLLGHGSAVGSLHVFMQTEGRKNSTGHMWKPFGDAVRAI